MQGYWTLHSEEKILHNGADRGSLIQEVWGRGAHVLCECEELATLGHAYLDSFSLDSENARSLTLGVIWNFPEGTGLP